MSGFIGDSNPSILGGGAPGAQPKGGLLGGGGGAGRGAWSGMEGGGERGISRKILRSVFGNRVFPNNASNITPFRRYLNAGDTNGTVNSGPSSLVGQSINQVKGRALVSRIHGNGGTTITGNAYYSGNPKYVYDSSVYVGYKRLFAVNRTYNDKSFGGDASNAAQSALRRVRRGF